MTMRINLDISRISKFLPFQNEQMIILSLLLIIISGIGCSSEESSWERIEAAGVLRVGLDPTYPPFELTDGQNLWGLDVDLSHALADELGLSVEFSYFGYDGLYDALGTQQVDTLLSALVFMPNKTRDFSYSKSYFNAGQILVSLPHLEMNQVGDLEGMTVAVELGSEGHVLATRFEKQLQSLNILPLVSSDLALEALVNDKAEAALVDHISARLYRIKEPKLRISDHYLSDEPYSLVVRSRDQELLRQIDQALQNLSSSGELERIISTWLDQAK